MSEQLGNHEKFLSHLERSNEAVWFVAQWLNKKGYSVNIPPSTKAETHKEWRKHKDNGDIFISQRVEVKHLSAEFTSRDNWPFQNKFIVCAKHSFDNATPKPFAYIVVNASKTAAGVVLAADSKKWNVEQRKDGRYENVAQEFYLAPLDDVYFVNLV